jgi:hypothetical protein
LKDIDYAGYTERFRALQVRHLNNVLSLERLGRLMDAEILERTIISLIYYVT